MNTDPNDIARQLSNLEPRLFLASCDRTHLKVEVLDCDHNPLGTLLIWDPVAAQLTLTGLVYERVEVAPQQRWASLGLASEVVDDPSLIVLVFTADNPDQSAFAGNIQIVVCERLELLLHPNADEPVTAR